MMTDNERISRKREIERQLTRAVARLNAGVLAIVLGLMAGIGLFAMTAILLIDGGPRAGAHLRLLGQYFIGYSVTWTGAVIGFFWASFTGGVIGWSIGMVYNRIVGIKLSRIVARP